tara:strand:- start:646 stop:1044 length:399 start_codon:yes stop_codon:yes gene_type:complete
MKTDIKQKWLEALRSGKYRKGTGQLREQGSKTTKPRYCCLGVLCDLYIKETGKAKWENGKTIENQESFLTNKVMRWSGLLRSNPKVFVESSWGGKELFFLADINDGESLVKGLNVLPSFKEIANLIEEKIKG